MAVAQEAARPRLPARFADHVSPAVEELDLPVFVLDRDGTVVWLNAPAAALAGDATGRAFTSLLDTDDRRRAEAMFHRNVRWARHPDYSVDLPVGSGSSTRVQISSTPLGQEGYAIAIFGAEKAVRPVRELAASAGRLTDRQAEILALLAAGASNDQIAERLSLSHETVRNHVRHIVERLGVRSRLEAVALARG